MLEYKWRTFNNFPEHDYVIHESRPDSFQFNAIGVGEISGAAAASATMMAISDAIGVNVAEYPATPNVILRALGKISDVDNNGLGTALELVSPSEGGQQ
jgi:CO/xanthine dehydrogenase Mo-binding subunit